MQFIINTSVDPHFCALFDEQNNLVDKTEWTIRKADGKNIFNFLQKHDISNMELSLIGGISGPGGFSSLRVTAGVLNSISFAKNIPIHQVRADSWISAILTSQNHPPNACLLNSFSDGVFFLAPFDKGRIKQDTTSNIASTNAKVNIKDSRRGVLGTNLERITIQEAAKKFSSTPLFVDFLPPEKKEFIKQQLKLSLECSKNILLEVLEKKEPQKTFIPDYEFPPV